MKEITGIINDFIVEKFSEFGDTRVSSGEFYNVVHLIGRDPVKQHIRIIVTDEYMYAVNIHATGLLYYYDSTCFEKLHSIIRSFI